MKKEVFTLPFLISLFLLNTGFMFKPKVRAFTCGDSIRLSLSNRELLKIPEEMFIYDNKGVAYQYDYASNKVSPEEVRTVADIDLILKDSYLEGSNFYVDYELMMYGVPGRMQFILNYDRYTLSSNYSINGFTEYTDPVNCKEIEFPKDTKFEY